jgi:hypothetical protein
MLCTRGMPQLRHQSALRAAGRGVGRLPARSKQPRRRLAAANSIVCSASAEGWQARIASAVCRQPAFQLAATVLGACQRLISSVRDKCEQAFPQLKNVDKQVRRQWACTYFHTSQPPPLCMHRDLAPCSAAIAPLAVGPSTCLAQALTQQLLSLRRNMHLMALVVLPLARASSESLTAVYARTFEKAAFGFAKVCGSQGCMRGMLDAWR